MQMAPFTTVGCCSAMHYCRHWEVLGLVGEPLQGALSGRPAGSVVESIDHGFLFRAQDVMGRQVLGQACGAEQQVGNVGVPFDGGFQGLRCCASADFFFLMAMGVLFFRRLLLTGMGSSAGLVGKTSDSRSPRLGLRLIFGTLL